MIEKLRDLIQKFNTTPFLFIGSGLTIRYYNLPNWANLLKIFASRISDNKYIYNNYVNKAQNKNDLSEIAGLIEADFNDKWFAEESFRRANENYLKFIAENAPPLKVEIASYIDNNSILIPQYKSEIEKFEKLTEKSISGIITTNYDCFLEKHTDNYARYIGQEELIASHIQGIAEIYKIHGCITKPDSIVINKSDYDNFKAKSAYLAAKLMTIFLEYPIIFIGYSITDGDIREILKSIVDCLTDKNISKLANRFVFIEYSETNENIEISPYLKEVGGRNIPMTKVTLKNFGILYDLLLEKKPSIPVKILRLLKYELYHYTITHEPTSNLKLAPIDDERIKDNDYALVIVTANEIANIGLKGINANDWYRNIILEDLSCTEDDLLTITYHALIKSANKLPLNKYLNAAKNKYGDLEKAARDDDFDKIISNTIKSDRNKLKFDRDIMAIWDNDNLDLKKKTYYIAHLTESQIDIDDLEKILIDIFHHDHDILYAKNKGDQSLVSNIRRLIRIYDYIKYGKNKRET